MGKTDKAIRLFVAAAIVFLAFAKVITGTLALVLLILAVVFVVTSIIGTCPLYLPFGISTVKKEQTEK